METFTVLFDNAKDPYEWLGCNRLFESNIRKTSMKRNRRSMEYKKNDLLTVTIEDMGHDGEGVGNVDGYSVYVKDTVIGDKVQA